MVKARKKNDLGNNGFFQKLSSRKKILLLMLFFAFIALFFTSLIKAQNLQSLDLNDGICTATGSNCTAVQNSSYGVMFGMKVVDLGLISFSLLILLLIWQIVNPSKISETLIRIAGIIAGFFGAYFISLQIFKLGQFCIYCLVIDSSALIIAGLSLYYVYLGLNDA